MGNWFQSRGFGVLCLVLSAAGWGVTFGMNRYMLAGAIPESEPWRGMTLAVFRFAVAGPVLVVWAAVILLRRRRLPWRDLGQLALLGLLGVVAYNLLANSAQTYASASLTAVLHQMTPAVAFVGGLIFLRERLTLPKLAGLVVASAGAVWYSLAASKEALSGDNVPLAVLLVFLVSIAWSLYLMVAKVALRRWSAIEVAVLGNACGAVMLLAAGEALRPLCGGATWGLLAKLSPAAWAVLLFLSLVAGVVCYVLYNAGLKRIEASRAAVFGYLLVPGAMISGLFLPGELREDLTVTKVLAAAVIIAGVWLVTYQRKSAQEQAGSQDSVAHRE